MYNVLFPGKILIITKTIYIYFDLNTDSILLFINHVKIINQPVVRVGGVTDHRLRGLRFKRWAWLLLLELEPVHYHGWSGVLETHALYHSLGQKKLFSWGSLTWLLNSHNYLGNYTKTKTFIINLMLPLIVKITRVNILYRLGIC